MRRHDSPLRSAVVAHGKGDLRIEEVPLSVPGPDEAVVEIAYGGICGSDLHYWLHGAAGESILKEPLVLGHEIVGVVVQQAADGTGPGRGTPVAVHPATPAPGAAGTRRTGPTCRRAAHTWAVPRATRTRTAPSAGTPTCPPDAPPAAGKPELRTAALVEPASVAWHAVARAGDVKGKTALVIGSGPIGALAVAVLKRAGAARIVAVDMHAKPLEIARAVGADEVLKGDDAEAIAAVEADVVIESSGSHHGLASAIKGATRGGKVVMVGLLPSGPQPVLISLAITRELELLGSFRFNAEIDEVIAALADGSLFVDPVVTHEFPLARGLEAFEVARNSAESGKVLLDFRAVARAGLVLAAGTKHPGLVLPAGLHSGDRLAHDLGGGLPGDRLPSPAAMASATSTCHCSAGFRGWSGMRPWTVRPVRVSATWPIEVGEHFVAGTGEEQGMETDVQLQEPATCPGLAGIAHGQRNVQQFLPKVLGRVGGGKFGGDGFDGGTQLCERPQLGAAALAGEAPADDQGIERIPAVGREHADPHPLDGLHQAEGLQDPDGFAHHGAGNLQLILKLLSQHHMAGGQRPAHNAGSQVFDGAVMEAG